MPCIEKECVCISIEKLVGIKWKQSFSDVKMIIKVINFEAQADRRHVRMPEEESISCLKSLKKKSENKSDAHCWNKYVLFH